MKHSIPTKSQGIQVAKMLKSLLEEQNFPIQQVFLFGSVAKGNAHQHSDIDIAVIHEPFKQNRPEELRELCKAERGSALEKMDVFYEVVYLHPDDLEDRYSTIAKEIQMFGITV